MLDKTSAAYKDAKERSRQSLQLSQSLDVVVSRLKTSGFSEEDALEIASDAQDANNARYKESVERDARFGNRFLAVCILLVVGIIAAVEYFSTSLALAIYGIIFMLSFVPLFFVLKEISLGPDPSKPADNRPAALEDLTIITLQVIIPFVFITIAFGAFCSRLEMVIPGSFSQPDSSFWKWQLFAVDNTFSGVPFDITDVFELQFSEIRTNSLIAKCIVVLSRALIEMYLVAVFIKSVFIIRRNGLTFRWENPSP